MHLLATYAFLLLAITGQSFVLPAPSGPQRVGTSRFGFVDRLGFAENTDQFRLSALEPVQLWYPADGGTKLAPYIDPTTEALLAKAGYYEQSAETIHAWSTVTTHAYLDASIAKGKHPLLILLPGAGACAFQYTALAEEFASRGFMVAVLDYYAPSLPDRKYDPNDSDAATNDIARVAVAMLDALGDDHRWKANIDFDKVGVAGHSIGGAAAIAAARLDRRILASVDMDGGTFGDSNKGAIAPVLVLRSKPIYSDDDLKKRGRTREQFENAGQEARRTWLAFIDKSGKTEVKIHSILGTGHFSFSDAPFTMPDAINRFGGKIIDPARGQKIISTCFYEFFDRVLHVGSHKYDSCSKFPEIISGIPEPVKQ
jgi:dienelactone hydrolase